MATVCVLVFSQAPAGYQPQSPMPVAKGQRLEALAWPEAERVLTPETVVVLPVGAASKEHGRF
jgi:creatinine amidohydrolase